MPFSSHRSSRLSQLRHLGRARFRRALGPSGLDQEFILEIGIALFALGLAVGWAALISGRATAGYKRMLRRAEKPPASGSVPAERHQNVGVVAAR